jgi:hypothetical protein
VKPTRIYHPLDILKEDVGFTHPTARYSSLHRDIRLGKVSSEWAGMELKGDFGE